MREHQKRSHWGLAHDDCTSESPSTPRHPGMSWPEGVVNGSDKPADPLLGKDATIPSDAVPEVLSRDAPAKTQRAMCGTVCDTW